MQETSSNIQDTHGVWEVPLETQVIIGLIGIFVLFFIIRYCMPFLKLRSDMARVLRGLALVKKENADNAFTAREKIAAIFADNQTLFHPWQEYQETLHDQYANVEGERRVINIRSTIPAEAFFKKETVIDAVLGVEFFKHLPGILTGVGIIGTFLGLINALSKFDPTSRDEELHNGLKALMEGVHYAFIASATAIVFAMVVTLVEKLILTSLYKQLDAIVQAVDSVYEAGAGEEYLSQLVKSSEDSATQTKQLRDSLVADLKEMLTNLTDKQIAANQAQTENLSRQIGSAIHESLREPLAQITELTARASGKQEEAVGNLLSDLLSAFMAKIEDVFGGQISGLNTMMGQSVQALQDMQIGFRGLVDEMRSAGKESSASVAEQLSRMFSEAEARQEQMNIRMTEFLGELREQMKRSTSETEQQQREALQRVGEQMEQFMESIAAQRKAAMEQDKGQQQEFQKGAQEFISSISEGMDVLIGKVAGAVETMENNISTLGNVSITAIEGMKTGAENMRSAADRFSDAGTALHQVIGRSNDLFANLGQSSTAVTNASKSLEETVAAYNQTRTSLTSIVSSLQSLFQDATDKAEISRAIVTDLQKVSEKMKEVQAQSQEYLSKVSDVLTTSFNDFNQAMGNSVNKTKGEFHSSLSSAVEIISDQIEDLQDAMEGLTQGLNATNRVKAEAA